ncbi:MAG: hypothetical protein ACLFRU_05810 [Paracoccaceae bacterium]
MRGALTALLVASLCWSAWNLHALWRSGVPGMLPDRPLAQVEAELDRLLASHATPATVAARLERHLAAEPRNWLAIEAIEAETARLGLDLPPDLGARIETARATDEGLWRRAGDCATCIWDAGTCPLDLLLACRAPVDMTPLGDLAGIARAGTAYAKGTEIDEVDLTLSVVGLGATALVVVTGGSSVLVKAGAGLGKLARRMGAMPPYMARALEAAAREGLDWKALPGVRSLGDLKAASRPGRLAPATRMLDDAGMLVRKVGPASGLYLLGRTGDATELARLSRASEAMGPRTLGATEMLGPARVARATLRWADKALELVLALLGALAALAGLLASGLTNLVLRRIRRAARR